MPIYEQIVESVALAIAASELRDGDALPSVRGLAAELRVDPNTAARALKELERLGLATAHPGKGSVVAKNAAAAARRHRARGAGSASSTRPSPSRASSGSASTS